MPQAPEHLSVRYCIDALNLAYWGGRQPSLRVPMALLTHLLASGHAARLYFDASARHRLAAEATLYEALMQHPAHCIEVIAGRSADTLLLRDARATGAILISRDHFADHRRRYRKLIDDPARRLGGWMEPQQLCIPGLGQPLPLPATAAEAWAALAAQLAPRPVPVATKSRLAVVTALLLSLGLPQVQAVQAPPTAARAVTVRAPPSVDVVRYYTQPMIRARLRLPESLRDFVVTQIAPTADDPARFLVTLQFKAKAPFGGYTQHRACFHMKQASGSDSWVVTAD